MFLRELFEEQDKIATAAFGRMNPPTIGHQKLVDKINQGQGDHFLFLSHTYKPTGKNKTRMSNPLPYDFKVGLAQKAFGKVVKNTNEVNNPISVLVYLESLGYTKVYFVAGSDRVEEYNKLFSAYQGKDFNIDFEVVNAGMRDPDADGAEGMSGTKMREFAISNNLEGIKSGLPDAVKNDAEAVLNELRKGLEPWLEESIDEVSDATKQSYVDKAKDDHYKMFTGKKPGSKHKLDKRRASIQKVSKSLSGKKSFKDYDPKSKEYSNEAADLVLNKASLISYIRDKIIEYINNEKDLDKLAELLKQIAGKTISPRGSKRFTVSDSVINSIINTIKEERNI